MRLLFFVIIFCVIASICVKFETNSWLLVVIELLYRNYVCLKSDVLLPGTSTPV